MSSPSNIRTLDPHAVQQTKAAEAIDAALSDARTIVEETLLENPKVFQRGSTFTVADFRDNLLHRYDRDRLKVRYLRDGEKTATHEIGRALERAFDDCPFIKRVTNEGVSSVFEVARSPRETTTYEGLIVEVQRMRQSMRNYKEIGAVLVDLMGAAGGLRATCEEQERVVQRLAVLALHYRERAINLSQDAIQRTEPNLSAPDLRQRATQGLDPDISNLEEMLLDPESAIKLTDVQPLHGLLTNFTDLPNE